jgi:hypothetical protein
LDETEDPYQHPRSLVEDHFIELYNCPSHFTLYTFITFTKIQADHTSLLSNTILSNPQYPPQPSRCTPQTPSISPPQLKSPEPPSQPARTHASNHSSKAQTTLKKWPLLSLPGSHTQDQSAVMKAVTPEGEMIGWACWVFFGFEDGGGGGGGGENVPPPVEQAVKVEEPQQEEEKK